MTTAVTKQPAQQADVVPYDAGGVVIRNLDDLYTFSNVALASGMAPRSFQSAEAIMLAVMHGKEVGFSPVQSLQRIAVINNRPSIWGDALPALAFSHGVLAEFREWFEGEGDNLTACCYTRRKGWEEGRETRFSVADAKQSKLWKKAGPWTDYPRRMLQMRARSWNFRDNLADVLCGMHVAEEVQDFAVSSRSSGPAKPAPSVDPLLGEPDEQPRDATIDAEYEEVQQHADEPYDPTSDFNAIKVQWAKQQPKDTPVAELKELFWDWSKSVTGSDADMTLAENWTEQNIADARAALVQTGGVE